MAGSCRQDVQMEEEGEGADAFLPGFPTFEDFSKALVTQVMTATKSSNKLPQEGDDYDYYDSFPGFQAFSNKMARRVDRIISKVIRHQQLPCYWGVEDEGGVSEASQLEEKFETLIEANDVMLERASLLLDEVSGLRKNVDQPVMADDVQQGTAKVASWNYKRDAVRKKVGQFSFIHSRNVPRPQVKFRDHVDNSNTPFIPRLTEKPNAKEPLPDVYEKLTNPNSLSALIANAKEWAGSEARLAHPYKFELDNYEPLPEQLELKEPQLPGSLEDTPLTFIDSLEQLEALKEELKGVKEFAIDLEHHSYRTFLGITCLMQISTRFHDYLIDTLQVRHHMHILLDPFTDPAIVKVMHGAEFDMHWMQRDFGLYVVNMFDTGQASRVLELPRFSLAFLLHYCCEVEADKQFQLADWRLRPLPQEMAKYAREDTHYLLYIYERMRNELIRRESEGCGLLQQVLTRSRDVCLRLYEKPVFSDTDYYKLYLKHKRKFNSQQLHCLQLLYAWRDRLAREEDESPGYVLPNHMLFQIAEILPREPGGVLACCNPIPILLRQQQQEVFLLVRKARDTPPSQVYLPQVTPKTKKKDVGGRSGVMEMETEQEGVASGSGGGSRQGDESGQAGGSGQGKGSGRVPRTKALESAEMTDSATDAVPVCISGPPVKEAEPVIGLLKAAPKAKPLPKDVAKKLKDITQSFPDILGQYEPAKVMTPEEVMIQQQLAYEALSQSAWAPPTAESPAGAKRDPIGTPDGSKGSKGTPEGSKGTPDERPASKKAKGVMPITIHEDQDEDRTDGPTKKPCPVGGATSGSDFQPFQYEGSSYTQYTRDRDQPMEAYDPHSAAASGRGNAGKQSAASRSRVQQKSGQRSQTYTPRNKRGRQK